MSSSTAVAFLAAAKVAAQPDIGDQRMLHSAETSFQTLANDREQWRPQGASTRCAVLLFMPCEVSTNGSIVIYSEMIRKDVYVARNLSLIGLSLPMTLLLELEGAGRT